jgi:hypothetical protein
MSEALACWSCNESFAGPGELMGRARVPTCPRCAAEYAEVVRWSKRAAACLAAYDDAVEFAGQLLNYYESSPRPLDAVDVACMRAATHRMQSTYDELQTFQRGEQ